MRDVVSFPEELATAARRLARRLGISRTQLYRKAVAEYVARHDPDEVTRAYDRVADLVDTRHDAFARAAALRVLR